jgi:extracellular factor (EF) 3-hydroxypalmitic acid methyl ester biosynthesis protein
VNVLRRETSRVAEFADRPCRVLSLGCGAARETQHFVRHDALSEQASFLLLDFNPDTVKHAQSQIDAAMAAGGREVSVEVREYSVQQMLASGTRLVTQPKMLRSGLLQRGHYDVIYCAGLFDYLSDRICKRLLEIFWHLAAPGAVIVASNFAPSNPIKGFMDYVLDWRLLYREEPRVRSLAVDDELGAETQTIVSPDGVEIFLTMRKPVDAATVPDDRLFRNAP